jgi:hypothetical protein
MNCADILITRTACSYITHSTSSQKKGMKLLALHLRAETVYASAFYASYIPE